MAETENVLATLGTMTTEKANPAAIAHNFGELTGRPLYNLISKATNSDCERASAHLEERIDIVNWFAHMVEISAKGNIPARLACRVVLFAKDDKRYAAVSSGVLVSLITFARCFGLEPLPEPIPINFKEIATRGSNSFLFFEAVEENE